MKKIILSNPIDKDYINPSAEVIEEVIFQRSRDYWKSGYPEIMIDFFDNDNEDEKSYLLVNGLDKYGYRIEHKYSDLKEKTFSLSFGEFTEETVEAMNSVGESEKYFRQYFVPKEIAWQAIEFFLKTGERDPSLTWEIAEIVETA